MSVQKFKKKPVVIDAVQFTGNNFTEVELFIGKQCKKSAPPSGMGKDREIPNDAYSIIIPTLEGDMRAIKLDWIIRGVKGEFYPCKPDIFDQTYETYTTPTESPSSIQDVFKRISDIYIDITKSGAEIKQEVEAVLSDFAEDERSLGAIQLLKRQSKSETTKA